MVTCYGLNEDIVATWTITAEGTMVTVKVCSAQGGGGRRRPAATPHYSFPPVIVITEAPVARGRVR
jgi:hypothetical protein